MSCRDVVNKDKLNKYFLMLLYILKLSKNIT